MKLPSKSIREAAKEFVEELDCRDIEVMAETALEPEPRDDVKEFVFNVKHIKNYQKILKREIDGV